MLEGENVVDLSVVSPWALGWNAFGVKIMLRVNMKRHIECCRVKNGHAGATEQFAQRVHEHVFGISCFVCDRLRFTHDTSRRKIARISSQSQRNIIKMLHQLTLSIRIMS